MSQSAYSEETKKTIEKEQPIVSIVALLPEFSSVVAENSCNPSLLYNNKTKGWEVEFGFQGEQSPIIEFLERIKDLNINGVNIDTTNKKLIADNISTIQNLIETYIKENPDHLPTDEVHQLNGFYQDAISGLDSKKIELSENKKHLIQMVARLPIHQMISGRFTIGYKETDDGLHQIIFTPQLGEAKEEIELFFSRIEHLKIDGISSNKLTLSAQSMEAFERLIEGYIEQNPIQIGDEKIADITNNYLAYKSDKLEVIKQELTEQNNGEIIELDFQKNTPYPRSTYALYRGFETVLSHYGHEINNFTNPENVYSIAWNIAEDESNFFIFVDAIKGDTVNSLQERAITLQENLLHFEEETVTIECVYLTEPNQCRLQITAPNINDLKNIVKTYYDTAQITQSPEDNEGFSYLKTSFIGEGSPEIITPQELLSLPTKPIFTAKELDITPQPITIKEIEGTINSEIGYTQENRIDPKSKSIYNPQFNLH